MPVTLVTLINFHSSLFSSHKVEHLSPILSGLASWLLLHITVPLSVLMLYTALLFPLIQHFSVLTTHRQVHVSGL